MRPWPQWSVGVFLVVMLLLTPQVFGATRLGLQVTQEELNIWRARMTDNVNGINGYTYQQIYQNRLLAEANEFVAASHPGGDGYWVGYTGPGCVPLNDQSISPRAGSTGRYGRGNGGILARTAFVYLLTGNVTYANAVKAELVNQTTVPGTDWTNTSKWCFNSLGGGNMLEIVPWVYRLLLAYDYLEAGGYTGWLPGEENAVRTWFYEGATRWDARLVQSGQGSPYPGMFDEPQDLTLVGGPGSVLGPLWYGGPTLYYNTYFPWYNQPSTVMALSMAAGLIFNHAGMIDHAKKFFTGHITAGTWSNGANPDFTRWYDCVPGCPGGMWAHAQGVTAPLIAVADMLARTGDTSLYALDVPSQVSGGDGLNASLGRSVDLWAAMINKTVTLYGTTDGGDLTPGRVLTWDSDVYNEGWAWMGNYYDFSLHAANIYYNKPAVHTAMTRNLLADNNNASGCNDAQFGGCFNSVWVYWPDPAYMYGNLEGIINPYAVNGATAPTVTITTNGGSAFPTTSTSTLLQGTAVDDGTVTSVTVSCTPSCGSPTVTGIGNWSVTVPLQYGINTITVTATDDQTNAGQSAIAVTRHCPSDISQELQLYLPLDGTTTDTSGDGRTVTPTDITFGSARPNLGQAGEWNGTSSVIVVSGLLDTPATITLAAWVNPVMTGPAHDVMSLGDAALLRLGTTPPEFVSGIYHMGGGSWDFLTRTATTSGAWHHVAYVLMPGDQRLYLDGVLMGTPGITGSTISYGGLGANTAIGRHGNGTGNLFQGSIDEVRVYACPQDVTGIQALVNYPTDIPVPGNTVLRIVR